MDYCIKCGKELESDEIAVHKKLVNRGAKEFLCVSCLAAHFKVSKEMVYERIEYFRAQGCALFESK